jgi:serine/threonine protein kinase
MDRVRAENMAQDLLKGPIGGWIPQRLIGNGKSALVLYATRDDAVAALKVFDPELVQRYGEEKQMARIDRERRLIGKEHPNLVRIYDGGKCERTGYLYVAMEYIDAPDLSAALSEVPRDRIRPLIAQLASAAKFLESLDLVHRDIKPANIAVTTDFDKLILLDLGVLRPFNEVGLTDVEERLFIGTHQYGSPEYILRKEEQDTNGWRAVTFYQIGGVLHDLIMRRPLFEEFCNPIAVLCDAIRTREPVIESGDADPDLVLLAKNCLCKSAALRLRLVQWESFDPTPPMQSVASMRDRIKKRQAMSGQAMHADEGDARKARLVLDEIAIEALVLIRRECVRHNDIFPPVEAHDHHCPVSDEDEAEFWLGFPKYSSLDIHSSIVMVFRIKLLDATSKVVEITLSTALTNDQPSPEIARDSPRSLIFLGAFAAELAQPPLYAALYAVLEEAMKSARLPRGETRALTVTLPELGE